MSLFAFDFDGTLLPSFSSPLPNLEKEALFALLSRGNTIVFSSGRPLCGCKAIVPFNHPNIYFLTINGAACYSSSGELLFSLSIDTQDALGIIKRYGQGNILPYAYATDDIVYGYTKHRFIDLEMDVNHLPPDHFEDMSHFGEHPILKVMLSGEPEDIDSIRVSKEDEASYSIARSNPVFLEFNAKGVNKGTSLGLLADKLGISRDDVYAFGDADNDADMIGMFHGVAMGNASKKCKDNAELITDTCENHGAVLALRKLGFLS